jgi:zinc protease
MIRLLERLGLAFGADTNAQTSFDHTTYQLDLPRNDASLIDTALMLMRETASELTFPAAETTRERGVVLAEKRDRNSWSYRALEDRLKFTVPGARFAQRLPIGTTEALDAATPDTLRAFWSRHYVPASTTVIVVGDVDPAAVESAIKAHFASWKSAHNPPEERAGRSIWPQGPHLDLSRSRQPGADRHHRAGPMARGARHAGPARPGYAALRSAMASFSAGCSIWRRGPIRPIAARAMAPRACRRPGAAPR